MARSRAVHFVTGNEGKLREIRELLGPHGIVVERSEMPFIEIQADSLEEVVEFGIAHIVEREKASDLTFFKEDAGLFIDELSGFPGVYSAYVQKTIGNEGILELMKGAVNRKAVFRAVIGLKEPGRPLILIKGECRGIISEDIRGNRGFGYDPIFIPDGEKLTFGQMDSEKKNTLSHRGRAARGLLSHLTRMV